MTRNSFWKEFIKLITQGWKKIIADLYPMTWPSLFTDCTGQKPLNYAVFWLLWPTLPTQQPTTVGKTRNWNVWNVCLSVCLWEMLRCTSYLQPDMSHLYAAHFQEKQTMCFSLFFNMYFSRDRHILVRIIFVSSTQPKKKTTTTLNPPNIILVDISVVCYQEVPAIL